MITLRSVMLLFVLHALWQVPLLLGAGLTVSRIAGRARAELQYRLWIGVLSMQILLPALCAIAPDLPALLLWLRGWLSVNGGHQAAGRVVSFTGPAHVAGGLSLPSILVTPLVGCYFALTSYRLARLLQGCWNLRTLRRSALPVVPQPEVLMEWAACCTLFGLREAALRETARLAGPVTLGIRRKLILVPAGMLQCLTAEDRQAALAHECAHMQRNDFAWNLLLRFASIPIAFHPLVGAGMSRIAEAREMICDERAAEAVAGRQRYAKSLLRLAARLLPVPSASNLNAVGMLDAKTLERRLMHLQQHSSFLKRPQQAAMLLTAVVAIAGTWTTASALHLGVGTPARQVQAGAPVHVNSGIEAGNILTTVQPEYPQEARAAKLSGSVVLKATITEAGKIGNLAVLSGPPELTQSALDAVRQWTYKPYLLNGQPTAVETTITINYNLN